MKRVLLIAMMPLALATAAADETPDTSEWQCRFCPLPQGYQSDWSLGAAYVSEDAYTFGNYSGYDGDGAALLAAGQLRRWTDAGGYWQILGQDLGLDAREVALDWYQPGLRIALTYDELPRRKHGESVSPFRGLDLLGLPADWVRAGATSGMTALADQIAPVPLGYDRRTLGLALALQPQPHWQYELQYRREERDGRRSRGGSFISQVTLLPEPFDYTTSQIDASLSYTADRGHLQLAYYGSFFDSQLRSVSWDNPFTPLVPGAVQGRIAAAPSNEAHQLRLSGTLTLQENTRLSAVASLGRASQNEVFVPYTVNPELDQPSLPVGSPDASVDLKKFSLRLSSRPISRLRLRADLDVDDRDNRSRRYDFAAVESDLYVAGIRRNVPYSFTRNRARVRGDYRLDRQLQVSAAAHRYEIDRDFQEVATTKDQGGWIGAVFRRQDDLTSLSVKLGQSERTGSDYRQPDDPVTGQNPLLRKYNLADRDRDFAEAVLSAAPVERVNISIGLATSDEDYTDSPLGLLSSESGRVHFDSSIAVGESASVSLSAGREWLRSLQAGSAGFSIPDWFATTDDEIDTYSLALRLPQIRDKIDLGLEYLYSNSNGEITLRRSGSSPDPFPPLKVRLHSARLFADISLNPRYNLQLAYYHEKLSTSDWMLDGLQPDSLPSMLALGAESPDYSGGIFSVTFRYFFDTETAQ